MAAIPWNGRLYQKETLLPVVCMILLVAVRTRTVIVPADDVTFLATMPTWSTLPSPSISPEATTRQPVTPVHTVVVAAEAGVAKPRATASAPNAAAAVS